MKWRYFILLFVCSCSAQDDHVANESHLTLESKARLVKVFEEAFRDNEISRKDYDQSLAWVNATPCVGVDRHLADDRKAQLETAIAKEQRRKAIKIFKYFKSDGWFILLTNASEGDEPYMFYSRDPLEGGHPVTLWSGAATIFETSEVEQWLKEHAPGIPARVASCFAWHLTLNPE